MKKIILLIFLPLFCYVSNSQCPPNGIERTSVNSTNDGFVQTLSTNFYTDEYITISNILSTDSYEFVSTHSSGIHDYITITDESNVVIDYGSSPLTLSNIVPSTIRVHIRTNASCDTNLPSHILTIQDLTNAPTCYKPESPGISYCSDTRIDFYWSPPSQNTPIDYDWEIVPSGNAQGVGVVASGSTGGATNASSGNVLSPSTYYSIYI